VDNLLLLLLYIKHEERMRKAYPVLWRMKKRLVENPMEPLIKDPLATRSEAFRTQVWSQRYFPRPQEAIATAILRFPLKKTETLQKEQGNEGQGRRG
jgi:hypothetical protein